MEWVIKGRQLWLISWFPGCLVFLSYKCSFKCIHNFLENKLLEMEVFKRLLWKRKWQPTPVLLPGESQGQRSLVGCCLWGRTESDMTEATSQQQQQQQQKIPWDISGGGPVVKKRQPMQETWVQSLVGEDPTCCRATNSMNRNYLTCALAPSGRNYRAHTRQGRAHELQWRPSAAKSK